MYRISNTPGTKFMKFGLKCSNLHFKKNKTIKFEPTWVWLEPSLESLQRIHVKYILFEHSFLNRALCGVREHIPLLYYPSPCLCIMCVEPNADVFWNRVTTSLDQQLIIKFVWSLPILKGRVPTIRQTDLEDEHHRSMEKFKYGTPPTLLLLFMHICMCQLISQFKMSI